MIGALRINYTLTSRDLYLKRIIFTAQKDQMFQGVRQTIIIMGFSSYKRNRSSYKYSKTCLKRPLSKRPKNVFQERLSLNAGQKYCRMLQTEHFAILSTFIKLQVVIKTYVCLFLSGRFTQVLLYNSTCI